MAVMSFQDALADAHTRGFTKSHLLLGNGFSIACRPDSFAYGRLFDEADFSGLSLTAEDLFGLSGTTDFERVIEMLRVSAAVLDLYDGSNQRLSQRLRRDAEFVKDALADVLARRHPDRVDSIDDEEYASARQFLSHFHRIFTVNYDLLLYWTLLHSELEPPVSNKDGFHNDPDAPEADYVIWDAYGAPSQEVYYLHGGLHLYDAGSALKKLTWNRTGVPLVDQIRSALNEGLYPRVVTEGSSEEKLDAILHSAYLHKALRSLSTCGGALFVYGHSLAPNDDHILNAIVSSKFGGLYVSLYGDPESAVNQEIQHRATALASSRPARKPLMVAFYDAGSARVWDAA